MNVREGVSEDFYGCIGGEWTEVMRGRGSKRSGERQRDEGEKRGGKSEMRHTAERRYMRYAYLHPSIYICWLSIDLSSLGVQNLNAHASLC